MVLHAHELGPPVLLRHELHPRKFYSPHRARADISDLAALDEIMQGFHRLLERNLGVEAVDLEKVEVVELEAGEGGVDGFEDGGAGEACVGVVLV